MRRGSWVLPVWLRQRIETVSEWLKDRDPGCPQAVIYAVNQACLPCGRILEKAIAPMAGSRVSTPLIRKTTVVARDCRESHETASAQLSSNVCEVNPGFMKRADRDAT